MAGDGVHRGKLRRPHDLEEHLLEVRLLDGELGDGDVLLAQRPQQLLQFRVRLEADVMDARIFAHNARSPRRGNARCHQAARDPFDARQEILRGVQRNNPAGLEHRDAAAQCLGFFQVVRREDDRVPVAIELADEAPQALPQLHVNARRGLVEDDDRRLVHQRLADQHAPLHAARERAHVGVRLGREVQVMQDFVDPRVLVAQSEVAGLELERLAHAEKRIEHQLLRHHAQGCGGPRESRR